MPEEEALDIASIEESRRLERVAALAELGEMADRGDFDILLEKRNYRPRSSYLTITSIADLYLEESYVLDIVESASELVFVLEAVLTSSHPGYGTPAAGERYCYRDGVLVFAEVDRVEWAERSFRRSEDASGTTDLGNIDSLSSEDGVYSVEGDWGAVRIWSGFDPVFRIADQGR